MTKAARNFDGTNSLNCGGVSVALLVDLVVVL